MITVSVKCPCCQSLEVIKAGKQPNGAQRYRCQSATCSRTIFQLDYSDQGRLPETKRRIIEMACNGSGIRDTARVLGISTDTVLNELKKKGAVLQSVNTPVLAAINAPDTVVVIDQVDEAELDEMWAYVGSKTNPRWLWQALDHRTGRVLAYVFGRRRDAVFLELKALLEPFGITRYFPDGWGAYQRHLSPEQHAIGKRNTQQLERKHLTLRTRIKRLVRKTICFSKSIEMHDIVIGLFINRFEFGMQI